MVASTRSVMMTKPLLTNFEANRSEEGWCGVSNNNRLNQGVYVYICSVTLNNGSREMFVGDVTLIH